MYALPGVHFAAGARELWLIDARRPEMRFRIHHRAGAAFEGVVEDADGHPPSAVLSARVRRDRARHARGHWVYRLHAPR